MGVLIDVQVLAPKILNSGSLDLLCPYQIVLLLLPSASGHRYRKMLSQLRRLYDVFLAIIEIRLCPISFGKVLSQRWMRYIDCIWISYIKHLRIVSEVLFRLLVRVLIDA